MLWYDLRNTPNEHVVCRPSAPELLGETSKILFWGNSLAFDHSWNIPEWTAVNCARQGLTAKASLPLLRHLPKTDFSAVVLFFGTVELLHKNTDLRSFRLALNANSTALQEIYPDAKIIVMGVPEGSLSTWKYGEHLKLGEINSVLRNLPGTKFLDTTFVLSRMPEGDQSYDGIHLAMQAYTLIEQELAKELIAPDGLQ